MIRPLLGRSVTAGWISESVFDFYAGLIDPTLTARRIVARVEAVRVEARGTRSFVLKANAHFRGFRAGQHVNVTVEIDGVRRTRVYSPSNVPNPDGTVVLTVKRHPDGVVSGWMHDHLREGDLVELSQAFGDFVLDDDELRPLLFVAGGSGITPIMSLVRDVCARQPIFDAVVLVYARTYLDIIFASELLELAARHSGLRVHFAVTHTPAAEGDLGGLFSSSHLDAVASDAVERKAFVCGPPGLASAMTALWEKRSFPRAPLTESFAPPEILANGGDVVAATVDVTALHRRTKFSANVFAPLLPQAEKAGLNPPSGCRQGRCYSCSCRKKSGVVQNVVTGEVSSEPDEDIRLCVSRPLSNIELEL